MPYKNIEDKREAQRRHYHNNKDKKMEYQRVWREKNREREKEKTKEYNRDYYQKNHSYHTLRSWEESGLIETDQYCYAELYEFYLCVTHCELCNIEFSTGTKRVSNSKVMDHDHETGIFRDVVCHACNIKRG